ncbi:UNVERIFIED_CONTAM: hypothetical protein PYX00_002774 [Menopon gallinae]|uniref:Cyclic nucleotide-binding domain-containing protein n=1 Tax=Menopon gallinae TaxID=328185 RepID=A0AAW2HYH2_9NEOP
MASLHELRAQLSQSLEDIKRRDELISALERELDEKDALIRHLKNEIDKFQQVVKPLTRELGVRKGDRSKRYAISAEPVLNGSGDLPIAKIPKSPKSRELIKAAILDNDFMKNLEMTQIRETVDCMYPVEYAAGSLIIKEGDVGSIVYVMEGKAILHIAEGSSVRERIAKTVTVEIRNVLGMHRRNLTVSSDGTGKKARSSERRDPTRGGAERPPTQPRSSRCCQPNDVECLRFDDCALIDVFSQFQ